ncbi:MAG: glycosyltransferase family 9 protein [Fusobacteriaceae bacterium]|nr:glycosyltransferase family 9 protein [Fusobacteriaceae bacterium]
MRILIIRLSSIGDVILTTPVIDAWKEKYPESVVDFLVMAQFKDAVSGNPAIDHLLTFDKTVVRTREEIRRFALSLKVNGYDCVFDLHGKLRSRLITRYLGARTFTYHKRSLWKSVLVALHLIRYRVDDTIVRNYFGAFGDFGLSYRGEALKFYFSEADKAKTAPYAGRPVLARGASKNTKKWPLEYFSRLAALLHTCYGKEVVLIGGKEDAADAAAIEEANPGCCVNLAGKLSLKESGALLSQSAFLVCADSAPFHMARAAGIPTFVIFGPTSPGMFDFGERDALFYAGVPCSPCSLHGDKKCPGGKGLRCMREITPEIVMEKITETIKTEG